MTDLNLDFNSNSTDPPGSTSPSDPKRSTNPLNQLDPKELLRQGSPDFFPALARATQLADGCDQVLFLCTLRKRAAARGLLPSGAPLRLALLGGCSLYPLRELVEQCLLAAGFIPELFVGEYDNYQSEIRSSDSPLYRFQPQVTVLLPRPARARYPGKLSDPRPQILTAATQHAAELLELCHLAHDRTGTEILLGNYPLPGRFDLGAFRQRSLASDWSFRKTVNAELGHLAPAHVRLCDLEFLSARRGLLASADDRAYFESKQPGAADFLLDIAREIAHLAASLRRPTAKVLVLDLDNTLWGGVIGDDGLAGIELGSTSPRGEAFQALQAYLLTLNQRGVLLAVCSKNDPDKALEPFDRHPEMLLRREHIAAFYANWAPKSDNLRAIAADLGLGLDSLVFVDDNPAEIDIVQQFAQEVRTILLGPDPSTYAAQIMDCRLFEPHLITPEDELRASQYRAEAERKRVEASATDMDAYLASLDMSAALSPFTAVDVPRIAQLINKSNQWNLTTRRRTEAEVEALRQSPAHRCFTLRLADRFGDHGLVVVVITTPRDQDLLIDTWLMSCRVLKRQVEEATLNEIFRLAAALGCARVVGRFIPTARNQLVQSLLPDFGFHAITATHAATAAEDGASYARAVAPFQAYPTHIRISRRSHDAA